MSRVVIVIAAAAGLIFGGAASAAAETSQSQSAASAEDAGVPLAKIVEDYARRNHKRIVVDPRVRAGVVTYGIDLEHVSFHELETILAVHGYAAIADSEGLIRVIPDSNVRQYGTPLLTGKADVGDAAVVTKVIPVVHLEASQLVPPLRPMLPQYGHLVAVPGSNALVIVSRYADVKAIEALVHELDKEAKGEAKN